MIPFNAQASTVCGNDVSEMMQRIERMAVKNKAETQASALLKIGLTPEQVRAAMTQHKVVKFENIKVADSQLRDPREDRAMIRAMESYLRVNRTVRHADLVEFLGVGPLTVSGAIGRLQRAGRPISKIKQDDGNIVYEWGK